jgi:hypothetical protein
VTLPAPDTRTFAELSQEYTARTGEGVPRRVRTKAALQAMLDALTPLVPPALVLPAPPPPEEEEEPSKRFRMDSLVIKIITADEINPHGPGSKAYKHFEQMRGGITVGEYRSRFSTPKAKRTARQWLWNEINDGHVITQGGD